MSDSLADLGTEVEGSLSDLGTPVAQDGFATWMKAHNFSEDPTYDYRGAYDAGLNPDENGHMRDTFKTPKHPTFSSESRYSGVDGKFGGKWISSPNNRWEFQASSWNLENQTREQLMDYFDVVEPGNTIRFPDGSSYVGGSIGPAAAGDEDYQNGLDAMVSAWFTRAQRGDPTHELEAYDLGEAANIDPDTIKPKLAEYRASAKAAAENPRRWRNDNPELFELLRRAPQMGPTVMREQSIWREVANPDRDAFEREHPIISLFGDMAAADPLTGFDEKKAGRTEDVVEKRDVEMQDLRHLSVAGAMSDTVSRTYGGLNDSAIGYARMYAEFKNRDSEASRNFRETLLQRRIARGLPAYYGDGVGTFIATGIADAVTSQSDSVGAMLAGTAVGLISRKPQLGAAVAKVAGAATSFVREAGGAYNEMVETRDDQGKPIDTNIAFAAANAYGALASAIEVMTLSGQMKGVTTLDAKAWAKGMLTDRTKRGVLLDLAAKLGKNAASEGSEEGAQQALQQTIQWLAKSVSAGEIQAFDSQAALRENVESAVKGGVGGLIGISLAQMGSNAVSEMARIRDSHRDGAHIAAITEVAKRPEAQAAPRQVAAWIAERQQEDGRKVTHLYVDPARLVEEAKKGGASPQDVATELMGPDGPQRLQAALDQAGDVNGARATLEVPVAEYLEKWGSKGIAETMVEDMTTAPGRLTRREQRLLQSDIDAEADALAEAVLADDEGVTAEEAALVGDLEKQLVGAGVPVREARQGITLAHSFARVMSKLTGIRMSDFLDPITVQRVGEIPTKPKVTTTVAGPAQKPLTFKTVKDAYESILDRPDISGVADLAYQKWKDARPNPVKTKDKAERKGNRERYKDWRKSKPRAFEGGTFDPVNEELELRGDDRVTGMREAFDKLFARASGSYVQKAKYAVDVLRTVQGLENLRIPDEYLEDDMARAQAEHVEASGEVVDEGDTSFDFGANAGTLEQSDADALMPASLPAIREAYAKMDPEDEGIRAYFIDRNTGLLNKRGFDAAFKEIRTHEVVAAFGLEGAKYFNDNHGHASVDGALRRMASGLLEGFSGRSAAKIGGDIYVIAASEKEAREIWAAMSSKVAPGMTVTYGGAIKKRKTANDTIKAAAESLKAVRIGGEKSGSIAPRGELPAQFRGNQGNPAAVAEKLSAAPANEDHTGLLASHSNEFGADPDKAATIYQDPSGLLNDEGFAKARELAPKAFVTSADLRGFKGMNDAFGREGTDAIKAWFNQRLFALGAGAFDFANLHGDEYAAQADDKEALEDFLSRAQYAMRRVAFWEQGKDGKFKLQLGIHFAHGTAKTEDQADRVELPRNKRDQDASGIVTGTESFDDYAQVEARIKAYSQLLGVDHIESGRVSDLVRGSVSQGSTGEQAPAEQVAEASAQSLALDDEYNLVVIHNLTASNVMHAMELEGSLPAPSIAVSRAEHPLEAFGEVSLLGGPELIDPKTGVPVFDADVYSPRWPDSRFDVDARKVRALFEELAPFSKMTGNVGMLDSSELAKDETESVVQGGSWIEVLGAAYVKEKGIELDPEGRTQDGSREGAQNYARIVRQAAREAGDDYTKWAVAKVKPVLGERRIVKRSDSGRTKKLPYTLENILREMTKKVRAGEQFNYGLGTARSFGAKKFTSIKQIQKARDRIVDSELFEELRDENNEKFSELASKLEKYHPVHKSGRSFGSLDSASMAIGDSYRRGATARSALAANGYDAVNMPAELVQEFANFATELIAMPTQYFEAKPQRAVKLSEFKVAVVPDDIDTEVLETLKTQGLTIKTFPRDESQEARKEAHQKAVQEAAEELGLLFQTDEAKKPRGAIDIAREGGRDVFRILLTAKADASTFPHEVSHAMFVMFEGIAKSPRAPARVKRDWATLRKWVKAEDGKELTREQMEQMARGFEAYLLEGKAPSSALAEAFASFRRWLLDVYKSITKLGVELDDNVRGVFDRMLATDREIEQARSAAGLSAPVFSTPQEAGVDPKDFDAYLEAQERVRSNVIMRTQQKIFEAELRAAKAFKSDEHKKLVEHFEREYDAMPVVRAWRYMRVGELVLENGDIDRNTGRGKVNRLSLESLVGPKHDIVKMLTGRITKSGGEDIIEIARRFDLAAADMVGQIAKLPDRDTWAKREADREMRRRHPEIDGEIANLQEAIQKLHHADTYDEAEREWAMIKARTTDQMTIEALQRAARLQVNERLAGRIDPGVVLNRERAFATHMAQAVAEGNFEKAMAFAHRRLLHKYLWKELVDARDMRDRFSDEVADLLDDKRRAQLGLAGPEYRDVVDTLLEKLQTTLPRPQSEPRADLGRLMGRMALDGNVAAFDTKLIADIIDKPRKWQELKIGELRAVLDALRNIKAGARNVTTMLRDGQRIGLEALILEKIEAANASIKDSKILPSSEQAETFVEKLQRGTGWYDGYNLRPETMLDWLGWGDIVEDLQKAKHRSADLMRQVVKPISEAFDRIPSTMRKRMRESIDGKALFPNHRPDMRAPTQRFELLMLALNAGNESNLERVLEGRNITREELMKALELLTPEELNWVQGVWDQIETLWPYLRELEERDQGLPLEKIPASPLTVNGVQLRGGYFPAVYDARVSKVGEKKEAEGAADLMDVSLGRYPSTNRSASKKRAEKFADAISLNPATIQSHIVRVTHDIAYREVIRSSARIFLDSRIKAVLREKLGQDRAKVFEPWLKDIGRLEAAQVDDHGAYGAKLMRYFRSTVPIAVLGHAIDNYLADPLQAVTVLLEKDLSKRHYAAAIAEFAKGRFDTREMVLAKSGELRSRANDTYQGFARRVKSMTQGRVAQVEGVIKQHAFFFAEKIENTIVTPVWLGAYRQSQAQGLTEAESIAFADKLVRRAFPSKSVVDKAAIQRDKGILGFMSMFVGYANWTFNQYRRIWNPVFQAEGTRATTLAATSALMSHLALAFIVGPVAELLVGHGPDKGEELPEWLLRKMLIAHLMPLPFVGGFVEGIVLGKKVSSRTPGSAAVEQLVKAIGKAKSGDHMDAIIEALKAYGYLKGLPTVRPARWLQYLLEADFNNQGGAASGLLYGNRKDQPDNLLKMVDRFTQ